MILLVSWSLKIEAISSENFKFKICNFQGSAGGGAAEVLALLA